MKNTKIVALIDIVKHQNKLIILNRYLQRQFFKSDGMELMLWQHLKKIIKKGNLESRILERDYVQEHLFDNNVKALNRTSSRLFQRIRNFMIEEHLEENQIIRDWLFRESIKTDKLHNNRLKFLLTETLLNTNHEPKNRVEEAFQYFLRFHVNYELYQEQALENTNIELFNKVRSLFNEYFIRYYKILEIEKEERQQSYTEDIIELVIGKVEKQPQDRIESLIENVKILDTNPEGFEYCKEEFKELVDNNLITREKKLLIFPLILNFANRQAVKGDKTYLLDNIEYYIEFGIEKQIMYVNYQLPIFVYTNYLSLIAAKHETQPIEEFAEKYLDDIEDKDRQKAKYFTDIFIAFYKKDYQRVVDIIHINENDIKVGFEFGLRSRVWRFLICSYFELKQTESLMSALQSFRRYIKRQIVSENKKSLDYKFIQYTRKIYKCTNLSSVQKVETQLSQEDNVVYRKWLNEKIKESYFKFT